jgi:hypothetical protein
MPYGEPGKPGNRIDNDLAHVLELDEKIRQTVAQVFAKLDPEELAAYVEELRREGAENEEEALMKKKRTMNAEEMPHIEGAMPTASGEMPDRGTADKRDDAKMMREKGMRPMKMESHAGSKKSEGHKE